MTTLICPLTALPGNEVPDEDQTGPPQTPFTRRVTTTLMNSLGQITRFIDQDTPDRIVHPVDDDLVISANLCEALVEMQPSGERPSLQVACNWGFTELAPQRPVETVQLSRDVFPLIEEFARSLRPTELPRHDRFVGRVDSLAVQPNQDGQMSGRATLIFLYDDETLRAQVDLSEQDYVRACDAHRDARYISLIGVLHRGVRNHTIQDYRDFTVL